MARTKPHEKLVHFKERAVYVLMSPVRLLKFICMCVGAFVIAVFTILGIYVWNVFATAPQVESYSFNDLKSKAVKAVFDKREDKRKKLTWVPIANINRSFLYSIVTSEDSSFFEHNGFNYDALAASLAENIKKKEYAYGGSTISQQVTKNLFLIKDKTLRRKAQEFIATKKLEEHFQKNEILELYLNLAEFGPDIFGVAEAAQHYFGKDPSQINAAEGTFIALMLPSPRGNYFKIFQNQNLTKQSRRQINRVLRDMRFNELISEGQYHQYSKYNYFKRSPASR